jgi:gliding motility-associated-like protein
MTSFYVKAQGVIVTNPTYTFNFYCQDPILNNTNELKFSVSPISALLPSNQFEIVLSNNNFANTTIITVAPANVSISGSQVTLTFNLPVNTYGSNYKFKVRTTAPAQTSGSTPGSSAPGIGLYYLSHNQEINLNTAAGISSAVYCIGSNFELFIYDSGTSSSPLFYPDLQYKWYKVNSPNDILVGSGPSLLVNQPGQYYVVTDYGECTASSFSRSRNVTVTGIASSSYSISSTSGNTICEGNLETLSLNIPDPTGFTFQWYRDDVSIPGATNTTYQTSIAGTYKAIVNNGSCESVTAPFVLTANTFNTSISPSPPYTLTPGQTLPIVVTTNANAPTFQWFLAGVLLAETSNTLVISETGDYSVIVNQTSGCILSQEYNLAIQKPGIDDIPNLISPNGDGINDTWQLPNRILNLTNLKIEIINSRGKKVLSVDSYTNNWPESEDVFINSNAVFYYIISQDNNVLHQGSLTVIK